MPNLAQAGRWDLPEMLGHLCSRREPDPQHQGGGRRPSSQGMKTLRRPENGSPWIIILIFNLFFNITDIQCLISYSNSKMFPRDNFYEAEG